MLTGRMVDAAGAARLGCAVALAMLTTEEVARFISPPPTTVEGFERFIAWTHRAARGRQLRLLRGHARTGSTRRSGSSRCASWSRASAPPNGDSRSARRSGAPAMFKDGARMVIEFAFDTFGVHRLEARAAVLNGRGNGALRKVGAMQEGMLRKSFLRTASISTRRCGPSSTRTGAASARSGACGCTKATDSEDRTDKALRIAGPFLTARAWPGTFTSSAFRLPPSSSPFFLCYLF